MKPNTKSLADILDSFAISYNAAEADRSDIKVDEAFHIAEQEILQWVSRTVVGHEPYPDESKDVTYDMYVRSGLRAEQREILRREGLK